MRVAALYRYPIKGFTGEERPSLDIHENGRIEGDRVLGLRFANARPADDAWGTKHEFVVLVNTPGLALLQLGFDPHRLRVRLSSGGKVLADEGLDAAGRERIASAVQRFVLEQPGNPLAADAARIPIRLVGDGRTPRYQDKEAGHVTLHGRASVKAAAQAAAVGELSEARFRSNIAVEGLRAWEEQAWIGRRLRIGDVEFRAVEPKTRCLATHANPRTGQRDVPVMQTLMKAFPAEKPTLAIALLPRSGGGSIHVGDRIELLD
ncbi:MAG TPA: MOSC domain-containing protein [Burkholderiales bacterium]